VRSFALPRKNNAPALSLDRKNVEGTFLVLEAAIILHESMRRFARCFGRDVKSIEQ
jgi:hypothetical protein